MKIERAFHCAMVLSLTAICLLAGCESSSPPAVTSTPAPADVAPIGENATAGDGNTEDAEPTEPVALVRPRVAPEEPAPKRVRPRTRIRSGGVLDIVFDDLEFDLEADGDFEREMLTDEIEALDGKTIILRGFILDASIFERTGIKKFVLVRDNQECCFGPTAKVFHNVWVDLDEGKTTKFSFRPVEIKGKFSIRPWHHPDDGKCYSVYHLQAESVK